MSTAERSEDAIKNASNAGGEAALAGAREVLREYVGSVDGALAERVAAFAESFAATRAAHAECDALISKRNAQVASLRSVAEAARKHCALMRADQYDEAAAEEACSAVEAALAWLDIDSGKAPDASLQNHPDQSRGLHDAPDTVTQGQAAPRGGTSDEVTVAQALRELLTVPCVAHEVAAVQARYAHLLSRAEGARSAAEALPRTSEKG